LGSEGSAGFSGAGAAGDVDAAGLEMASLASRTSFPSCWTARIRSPAAFLLSADPISWTTRYLNRASSSLKPASAKPCTEFFERESSYPVFASSSSASARLRIVSTS